MIACKKGIQTRHLISLQSGPAYVSGCAWYTRGSEHETFKLTSTVGAWPEGPLAVAGDVDDLVHADERLHRRGDLGAEARYVGPLDHAAAGRRRRDLGVGRELDVVLAVGDQVLQVLVAVSRRRIDVGGRRRRPRRHRGHCYAEQNHAREEQLCRHGTWSLRGQVQLLLLVYATVVARYSSSLGVWFAEWDVWVYVLSWSL